MTTNSLAPVRHLKHALSNINPKQLAYPDWLSLYMQFYMAWVCEYFLNYY